MKDLPKHLYINIILLIKSPSNFPIYRRYSPIFYTYKSRGVLKIILDGLLSVKKVFKILSNFWWTHQCYELWISMGISLFAWIQARTWRSPLAEWSHNLLWITEVKRAWEKLPYARYWVIFHHPCFQDVEALPHGKEVTSEDRQYESEVFISSTESKCEASQMVGFPRRVPFWAKSH